MTEGWKYLTNSPKFHYFRDGKSLCRRWMTLTDAGFDGEGDKPSPDNCAACWRQRQKELARVAEGESA